MPTYRNRLQTGVTEFGEFIGGEQTVATKTVMTEVILTFLSAPSYSVGETVTEADSGTTGVVFWQTGTRVGLIETSAAFLESKAITGADSGESQTPYTVENRLERTADTPVFSALRHSHAVTSTGVADDQPVRLDAKTRWILVTEVTAVVTVHNQTIGNPLITISTGGNWSIRRDAKFSKLVLHFAEAGSCTVHEFDTPDNPLK